MTQLEQIVEKYASTDSKDTRTVSIELLGKLAANINAARDIWSDAIEQACGEAHQFTFVLWFGSERAKALHRLHLEQKRLGGELTEATGITFSDTMGIVESIDVVEAYAQAQEESGSERVDSALETLTERGKRLHEVIAALSQDETP